MHRKWFDGVILGQQEIDDLVRHVGSELGDSISSGDTMVVRGADGEVDVYTQRYTEWPDWPNVSYKES